MQPGFQNLPAIVSTSDCWNVILLEPLIYLTRSGQEIVIPAGVGSDGASTPRFIWSILAPQGKHFPAAVLHDYLYRCTWLDKAYCDSLLKESAESLGCSVELVTMLYDGVKIGGQSSFDEDREQLRKKVHAQFDDLTARHIQTNAGV